MGFFESPLSERSGSHNALMFDHLGYENTRTPYVLYRTKGSLRGSTTREANSLDDLAMQFRQRFPDGECERTTHKGRDREAEQRWADAMNNLMEILVNAFVKEAAL